MEERNELVRRYLSFIQNSTNEELRSYNNIMAQATKPNSTVKATIDYFRKNPIQLHPRRGFKQTRKGY